MEPTLDPTVPPSVIPSSMPTGCDVVVDNFDCRSADCQYLFDLFVSTNGCNWNIRTNWLKNDDYCSWFGVTCTDFVLESQGFEITSINLSRNNLVGSIPKTFGKLWFLERIDLSFNELKGEIPSSLGQLSYLETLNLSDNSYDNTENPTTGIIPPEICDLTNLNGGELAVIAVDCGFPPKIDCVTGGDCCNYCRNSNAPSWHPASSHVPSSYPTGPTDSPSESPSSMPTCFTAIPADFTCDGYNLESTCEVLVDLYESMGGCGWTSGSVDSPIQRNSGNTAAWFSGTPGGGLEDPFCSWYGISCEDSNCVNGCDVTKIDLWNNNLRGTIPTTIMNLYQLTIFEVNANNIHGTIPTEIALLPNLQVLRLEDNQLEGTYGIGDEGICELISSGQVENFWTDCVDGLEVEGLSCDCCTYCAGEVPSELPSLKPTTFPSIQPTVTQEPSSPPSDTPSSSPTMLPSTSPSLAPTSNPSLSPTRRPSLEPSYSPSLMPTLRPSTDPTSSLKPSSQPSSTPTNTPTSGCYEPSDYVCESKDPNGSSETVWTFTCTLDSAKTACDITECENNVPLPKDVCCSCKDRVVKGNIFPSSNPTDFPSIAPTSSSEPSNGPSITPTGEPTGAPIPLPSLEPSSAPSVCTDVDEYECEVSEKDAGGAMLGQIVTCDDDESILCDVTECYKKFPVQLLIPSEACCKCK